MLAALEEAGLVNRVIGRSGGIFISHGQVQRSLSDVVVFLLSLRTRVTLSVPACVHEIAAPERTMQNALRIGANDYVIEIHVSAWPTDRPSRWNSRSFSPTRSWITRRQLGGSISNLETHYGPSPRAEERIEAVNATPDEASLLGIKPKSALLLITRIAYDQHGSPCEFSRDLFRGDRTRLAVTVQGHGVGIQSPVDTASVALQRQEVQTKAS